MAFYTYREWENIGQTQQKVMFLGRSTGLYHKKLKYKILQGIIFFFTSDNTTLCYHIAKKNLIMLWGAQILKQKSIRKKKGKQKNFFGIINAC